MLDSLYCVKAMKTRMPGGRHTRLQQPIHVTSSFDSVMHSSLKALRNKKHKNTNLTDTTY